jgi:hypothetical protein
MAKRYTCHLYFVELPDGTIQVTYEEPADDAIARPVDLIGPEPLEVPEYPQTQYEHDEWLRSILHPNGPYTERYSASRPTDLPPVEEEEVPDGPPEGLSLDARLEAYQRPGRRKTLLVVVRNTGDVPAPNLSAHWVYRNETPQAMQVGTVPAWGISGSLRLASPSSFKGTLSPGQEVSFLLEEDFLESLLGQVAALSPERYWIAVASGQFEVRRIDGRIAGDFLERLENLPVTYEFVPSEADSGKEDPEKFFKGFTQLKKRYPSLELFTITIPHPGKAMAMGTFLQQLSPFSQKMNAAEFEGRAPGTVRYFGPNSSSGSPLMELVFLYRPEGWNKEFRAETGRWEEIVLKATGKPPYEPADFAPLAAMKIKGWH